MNKFLRQISPEEAAIVRKTLEVGAPHPVPDELFESVGNLQVTALCECGCKTVWFGPKGAASTGSILAEGIARSGDQLTEIIVWLDQGAIVGLEFVCYELEQSKLPSPEEISSHAA